MKDNDTAISRGNKVVARHCEDIASGILACRIVVELADAMDNELNFCVEKLQSFLAGKGSVEDIIAELNTRKASRYGGE